MAQAKYARLEDALYAAVRISNVENSNYLIAKVEAAILNNEDPRALEIGLLALAGQKTPTFHTERLAA